MCTCYNIIPAFIMQSFARKVSGINKSKYLETAIKKLIKFCRRIQVVNLDHISLSS